MNTARLIVLTIAPGAGGIAAYPASGSDNTPAPTNPVARLQAADMLVANADAWPAHAVKPERTAA